MRRTILCLLLIGFSLLSFAGRITGIITDAQGNPLPYASVSVKGSNKGTTSNSAGKYALTLSPGTYTLICQYVGYTRQEKIVTITAGDEVVNFSLSIQELVLGEVIAKRGEDPAYEIIRQAI